MSQPKDYDTTIARIAGNIAAGMASSPHLVQGPDTARTLPEDAVAMALAIIAEIKRTEPR